MNDNSQQAELCKLIIDNLNKSINKLNNYHTMAVQEDKIDVEELPNFIITDPLNPSQQQKFCDIFNEVKNYIVTHEDDFISQPKKGSFLVNINNQNHLTIEHKQLIQLIIDTLLYGFMKLNDKTDYFFVGLNEDLGGLDFNYSDLMANMYNYFLTIPGVAQKLHSLVLPTDFVPSNEPTYPLPYDNSNLPLPNMPGGKKKTKYRKRKRTSSKSSKKRKYSRRKNHKTN